MRVEEVVAAIHSSPRRSGLATRVIAIDGCGGSGKSTLADDLSRVLSAPVVHTDDFASWAQPLEWGARFLSEVLEPTARGELVRFQRYNWTAQRRGKWVEVQPSPLMIIEGVGSSRLDFAQYIDFSIWVETDRSERYRRGIERDGAAMSVRWLKWMAAEDKYVVQEKPEERADLVVRG